MIRRGSGNQMKIVLFSTPKKRKERKKKKKKESRGSVDQLMLGTVRARKSFSGLAWRGWGTGVRKTGYGGSGGNTDWK